MQRKLTEMKNLGQRIRELRDERDLSLRELAKRVGRSPAFLSDIELGRRFPSPDVLSDIAGTLGVSVQDLEKYDSRVPVEELKERATREPGLGFALRMAMDAGVTGEELRSAIEKVTRQRGKK